LGCSTPREEVEANTGEVGALVSHTRTEGVGKKWIFLSQHYYPQRN